MIQASAQIKKYDPTPAGTFLARLIKVIQIGTIEGSYMGEKTMTNKVLLAFELPTKTKVFKEEKGPQPIMHQQEYTLSMGAKANLRKIVEGLIGVTLTDVEAYAFDIEKLAGTPCLLTIKHKTSKTGNVRGEISSVSPLMEGQTCPEKVNPIVTLSFSDWNQGIFESLPQFLQEKIKGSEEYKKKFSNPVVEGEISQEDADYLTKMREGYNAQIDKSDDINVEDIPF